MKYLTENLITFHFYQLVFLALLSINFVAGRKAHRRENFFIGVREKLTANREAAQNLTTKRDGKIFWGRCFLFGASLSIKFSSPKRCK